jgi:hypothetical protein
MSDNLKVFAGKIIEMAKQQGFGLTEIFQSLVYVSNPDMLKANKEKVKNKVKSEKEKIILANDEVPGCKA